MSTRPRLEDRLVWVYKVTGSRVCIYSSLRVTEPGLENFWDYSVDVHFCTSVSIFSMKPSYLKISVKSLISK